VFWHGTSRSRYVEGEMHAFWLLPLATPGVLSLPNHAEYLSLYTLCHALECNELVLRETFT
jgi:hypothetical protein